MLKSTPETDHVPRAEHINPIDVTPHQGRSTHRAYWRSKGHLLTPNLKI